MPVVVLFLLSCVVPVVGGPTRADWLDTACFPICDALPWEDAELESWRFEEGEGDPSLGWCVCTLSDGSEVPVPVNVTDT